MVIKVAPIRLDFNLRPNRCDILFKSLTIFNNEKNIFKSGLSDLVVGRYTARLRALASLLVSVSIALVSEYSWLVGSLDSWSVGSLGS